MSTSPVVTAGEMSDDQRGSQKPSRRFRFKRKERQNREQPDKRGPNKNHEKRERHRHHHHRRKRQRFSDHGTDDPSAYDDSISSLPPDQAFRESLFDALGDDEGAAFWEGVYGQPVHTYPNARQDPETGELDQMNDEEYAQYVRRKMWEKSWEGIEAAREEKRRQREQEKKQRYEEEKTSRRHRSPEPKEDYMFGFEIEASLRRGERRREQKHWTALWEQYLQKWEALRGLSASRKDNTTDTERPLLRDQIPWPVESGERRDVVAEEIERFMREATTHMKSAEPNSQTLSSILKAERVRWHPDKITQRYGDLEIDTATMQGVTAVFQILDRLWSEERDKKL